MKKKTIVITSIGGDPRDELFSNDFGTWNVSLAYRDCDAGKHQIWSLDTAACHAANHPVEVDDAKVQRFILMPKIFERPLLAVIEDGKLWLIDGHHRLRALHRIGVKEFAAYVIEDGTPYHVLYNGKRKPPFKPY